MEANQVGVALPVTVVELVHMKMTDGSPVRVRCEAVDELERVKLSGLPGAVPPAFGDDADDAAVGEAAGDAESDKAKEKLETAKMLVAIAPPLLHDATVLLLGDREVRPAFHCDNAHAVPGSIPWRMVRLKDKLAVVVAILKNSGAAGAADASFHGDDREGSGDSVGAVESGEGVRTDAVASPA